MPSCRISDWPSSKSGPRRRRSREPSTRRTTRPGIILGTIAYMSPEQASGRPTDARGDIFSFGVVLYELLAGRRPFEGASDLERLQAIIHGAAPPLGGDVPFALRMVVEKALEKAPSDRYQSMSELTVDLRRLMRHSGESASSKVRLRRFRYGQETRGRTVAFSTLASLALLFAGGTLVWWFERPSALSPRRVVQFDIPPPPETIFAPPIGRQSFAISPDGRRLAFTATGANGTNIWVRDLASPQMRAVPGTEGVWSVFWPPDGRSIFYSVNQTLMQANLETGSGRAVAELVYHAQIGTWRPNGDLLLYLAPGENYELRAEDGSVRKLEADKRHALAAIYSRRRPLRVCDLRSGIARQSRDGGGLPEREAGGSHADRFTGSVRVAAAARRARISAIRSRRQPVGAAVRPGSPPPERRVVSDRAKCHLLRPQPRSVLLRIREWRPGVSGGFSHLGSEMVRPDRQGSGRGRPAVGALGERPHFSRWPARGGGGLEPGDRGIGYLDLRRQRERKPEDQLPAGGSSQARVVTRRNAPRFWAIHNCRRGSATRNAGSGRQRHGGEFREADFRKNRPGPSRI